MDFKNFDGKCWWCGSLNISEEHKYKKTDIKREYFSTTSEQKIVLSSISNINQKGKIIQGPNSKYVKFKASLCQNCNNSKSQPFDEAYDIFIKFLKNNESNTIKYSFINAIDIYRDNCNKQIQYLTKYFIKHLCCTLTDVKVSVPVNLIDYLNGLIELKNVEIIISQSIDRKEYLELISNQIPNSSWLGCSDVQIEYNKRRNVINFLHYEIYYRSYSFYIKLDTSIKEYKTNFLDNNIDLILYKEDNFKEINTKLKTTNA